MPLTISNLDDSAWEAILKEVKERIPQQSPERTNEYQSDVEIMANISLETLKVFMKRLQDLESTAEHLAPSVSATDGQSGFQRPQYFEGQLLTAEDFNAEQQYQIGKNRLHNIALHGCGIVHGLNISLQGNIVSVSPGLALDCAGNEIVVPEPVDLKLPGDAKETFITLSYQEFGVSPVPVLNELPDKTQYSRIREGFDLASQPNNPWSGHKKVRSGWLPCGKAHPVPLGKLKFRGGRWRKSLCFHRPCVK